MWRGDGVRGRGCCSRGSAIRRLHGDRRKGGGEGKRGDWRKNKLVLVGNGEQ